MDIPSSPSTRRFGLILPLTLAALALAAPACGTVEPARFAPDVQRILSGTPRWVEDGEQGKQRWATVRTFYEQRDYVPAWIHGDAPTRQLDQLLQALGDAGRHGLDPSSYGYDALAEARGEADKAWFGAAFEADRIPGLDVRFTYAFLEHAADLLGWRMSPRAIDRTWIPAPKKVDLAAILGSAVEENKVRETLEELAPAHRQYRGLQAALAADRRDGSDAPGAERIRLNLERWRWAPHDLGERHVLVNVPAYRMQIVEGETMVLGMRVIVGEPQTPTPLFSDRITYVVFSPYWNIPESILREETLPRVANDPEYLARSRIEVVGAAGEVLDPASIDWEDEEALQGLRFRQAPGPENALGLVKFIFPNHFSVYLHDTPSAALFERPTRAFSHGCIRVEKPVELAEYVLSDKTEWTSERIAQAMAAKTERTVHLKKPLPVHIGYWTAWVEEDGSVMFFDDPYGLDRRHARLRAHRNSSRGTIGPARTTTSM